MWCINAGLEIPLVQLMPVLAGLSLVEFLGLSPVGV